MSEEIFKKKFLHNVMLKEESEKLRKEENQKVRKEENEK